MSEIRYEEFSRADGALIEELARLEIAVFEQPHSAEYLENELCWRNRIHAVLAYDGNQAVGFKVGYAQSSGTFYSWIGGVLPAYRSQGIARELLRRQHDWCRTQRFQKVRTHSDRRFREMMILNLRQGFNIIGTMQVEAEQPTVIFEKTL